MPLTTSATFLGQLNCSCSQGGSSQRCTGDTSLRLRGESTGQDAPSFITVFTPAVFVRCKMWERQKSHSAPSSHQLSDADRTSFQRMMDKSCPRGRCRLSASGCDTGSFLPAFPCCPDLPPLWILNCVYVFQILSGRQRGWYN